MAYKIVSISLTSAQAKALNARLKTLGVTRSQYVRNLMAGDGLSPTPKVVPARKTKGGGR